MLAADVRFEGFTHQDWVRVVELFRPRRAAGKPRDPDRPRGVVIAVHDGGSLAKLVHSQVGRLRLDDLAPDWPVSAEEIARRHHAAGAASIERGALEAVMDELGLRLRREDDLTTQWLTLLSLAQTQIHAGRIELWPQRLRGMPLPTKPMIDGTLDLVCPRGQTLLLGLFDHEELWTSIALRRGDDGIDRVLGPDPLRGELGLLSGDFRRDHRHLARVVAERVGTLSLGCFADYRTFLELEIDPTPGAWALAVAVRDVVLHPLPAAMAVPLGFGAGRAAFSALRDVASRLDPAGVFAPAMGAIRDVAFGDKTLEDWLGFQPFELLRRLLSRDR
jgi:hypothetical protein